MKAKKAAKVRAKAMHALQSSMARGAAMKVIGQSSKGTGKSSKVLAMKARVQSSKEAVKSSKATVKSATTKKKNEWINARKVTDALRAGLKAMKDTVQPSKAKQSSVSENWSWYDVRKVKTLWVVATFVGKGKGKLNVQAFGRLDV